MTPGLAGRFIEELPGADPTKNLALAALRHFFDALVTRHCFWRRKGGGWANGSTHDGARGAADAQAAAQGCRAAGNHHPAQFPRHGGHRSRVPGLVRGREHSASTRAMKPRSASASRASTNWFTCLKTTLLGSWGLRFRRRPGAAARTT